MDTLKLVLFDVDGTLIDSQHAIVDAMARAAAAVDLPPPPRGEVLGIVGLSLPGAVARLFPDLDAQRQGAVVAAYQQAYMSARNTSGTPPLYNGARAALQALAARDTVLLGTATGMSRRGMARVIESHDLAGVFVTTQTADDHPSKPDPAMVRAALRETGVAPEQAVLVGDTVYDIEAGRAAGVFTIGVTWGYHAADDLLSAGARAVIEDFADLILTLDNAWSET